MATEKQERRLMLGADELRVDPEQPWKDDRLRREEVGKNFARLLGNAPTSHATVISLHADYGTGKSFFLARLAQQLRLEGRAVLEFNAWETDYAKDPFIAFAARMIKALHAAGLPNPEKSFGEKAKRFAVQKALPIAIKGLSRGALSETDFIGNENLEKIGDGLIAAEIEALAKRLEGFFDAEQSMEAFKKELEEAGKALREQSRAKTSDDHPVVVLIDELDRCRPTYAVELLEHVKHFFSVPGFVFLVAIQREQLEASIGAIYGDKFDAAHYLGRFFNLELALEEKTSFSYAEKICIDITSNHDVDKDLLNYCFYTSASRHHISLRDQKNIIEMFKVLVLMEELPTVVWPAALMMCVRKTLLWRVEDTNKLGFFSEIYGLEQDLDKSNVEMHYKGLINLALITMSGSIENPSCTFDQERGSFAEIRNNRDKEKISRYGAKKFDAACNAYKIWSSADWPLEDRSSPLSRMVECGFKRIKNITMKNY